MSSTTKTPLPEPAHSIPPPSLWTVLLLLGRAMNALEKAGAMDPKLFDDIEEVRGRGSLRVVVRETLLGYSHLPDCATGQLHGCTCWQAPLHEALVGKRQ